MNAFEITASLYDSINGEQYAPYCDFLEKCFLKFSKIKVTEVLDLGCGTGGITRRLANRGFDMLGVDYSPDMLSVAQNATEKENDIRYICQDMRALDLYGTVQAAFSSFDCLNYLNSTVELDRVFSLLRNYIEKGGLFVFDVNTLYRYENVFADNSFVYEFEDDMLVWQNIYSPSKKTCNFYLTLFSQEDGAYYRSDEQQKQKYFSQKTILSLLEKNHFSVAAVLGSTDMTLLENNSEKAYIVVVAE